MKNIAIILIAFLIASCGRMKHTTATSENYTKDVQTTETTEAITTVEKIDTIVQIAPDSSEHVIPLKELTDTAIVVIDNDIQEVVLQYDPIAGTIRTKSKAKARSIPLVMERTTQVNRTVDAKTKSVQKIETREDVKVKTNPLIPFWIWFLALLVVIGYLCFRYIVKKPWT